MTCFLFFVMVLYGEANCVTNDWYGYTNREFKENESNIVYLMNIMVNLYLNIFKMDKNSIEKMSKNHYFGYHRYNFLRDIISTKR